METHPTDAELQEMIDVVKWVDAATRTIQALANTLASRSEVLTLSQLALLAEAGAEITAIADGEREARDRETLGEIDAGDLYDADQIREMREWENAQSHHDQLPYFSPDAHARADYDMVDAADDNYDDNIDSLF